MTEVTIHPPGDLLSEGALRLQLAPEGDFLILRQEDQQIEIDGADLPLLLEWGQKLLAHDDHDHDHPSLTAAERNPSLR